MSTEYEDMRGAGELDWTGLYSRIPTTSMDPAVGSKHDSGKPPMSLLPWTALREAAKVLDFGRKKYSAHNWRKGFDWSRLADADLRHLAAWLDGEDLDPETNLNHLAHHVCEALFLLEHALKNYGKDDRHKDASDS